MSSSFRIELNRTRAIAVSLCLLAAGLLLFVAGTISGVLLSSASLRRETAIAQSASVPPKPAPAAKAPTLAPAPTPAASDLGSNTESPSLNPPALAAVASAPQPAPVAAPNENSPPAPSTWSAPPSPAENASTMAPASQSTTSNAGDSLPLAVKVCSFTSKFSAENLVAELDAKGYRASMVRSIGAQGRIWYVVTLGPYKEWNSAAQVAARVAVAENVRPVVGQIP